MPPRLDITGERYGRLVAVRYVRSKPRPRAAAVWLFRCDCGNEIETEGHSVRTGNTSSCGCQRLDSLASLAYLPPGTRESATYQSWLRMRSRCSAPTGRYAVDYRLRGITVCERWNDYLTFLADMGEQPPGKTLDRKDNDGNYEPDNCRWATASEQRLNQRSPERVRHDRALAAAKLGVHVSQIYEMAYGPDGFKVTNKRNRR